MPKILTLMGASILAIGSMTSHAAARVKTFEVSGRQYSYDSTDSKAVAAARRLIEAANAADAARTKAEAALAANPLAKLFGSSAQKDATEAQERLDKVLAEYEKTLSARKDQQAQQARFKLSEPSLRREALVAPQEPNVAQPDAVLSLPNVKDVFIDVASGIKTTFMSDGTIYEELTDPATSTGSVERRR